MGVYLLVSVADSLLNAANASGNCGGVAGVLVGAHTCNIQFNLEIS